MTKFEFLNTLRMAMHGMPADKIERTVADYERRFEQGAAAGRTEEEIAASFGDPWDIAENRAKPSQERAADGAGKAGRVLVSGLGLTVFNLFMIIPAIVYASILFALWMSGIAVYFAGIAFTASSLAGVDELTFKTPFERIVIEDGHSRHVETFDRFQVSINESGIQVRNIDAEEREEAEEAAETPPAAAEGTPAPSSAASSASATPADAAHPQTATPTERKGVKMVLLEDERSQRTERSLRGVLLVFGGILLLLLSGVITRYTWIGLKKYLKMNVSVLRDA